MNTSFGEMVWLIAGIFVVIACLTAMFHILVDMFRDPGMGAFAKAL